MAYCLETGVDSYLQLSSITTVDECQYIVLESTEYKELNNLLSVSGELSIDAEIYTTVSGFLLLYFITGHILGRIVKTFGKV